MSKEKLSEEFKRMQKIAGIQLNENDQNEEDLIKQYYDDVLNLGGGDLIDWDMMMEAIEALGSFQELLKQELSFASEEDGNEEWIAIINKYLKY